MLFTKVQFRKDFPEFTDTMKYPDAMLDFWGVVAEQQVNACVWKKLTLQGIELYVAHEITIAAQSVAAANIGGTPGQAPGIANSKTVGSVSVGYDASTTTEKDAGWWNKTTYGQQFIRLARIFGAGGFILGARGPAYRGRSPFVV